MQIKPQQLKFLKIGGEWLADEAAKVLKQLTPKDTYLAKLNPLYLSNLNTIANTGKSTSLNLVRGTKIPSARMVAFLPETRKVGIHGYQGKSIWDPKHINNFGDLSHFIADNKLNAARYFAQHEELIMPFLKSPDVPVSQKKFLIELFQDGILNPLKQKGLKQYQKNNLLIKRAERFKKDPRIYDGTLKSLFVEDPKTHEILNWNPEEYQQFVDNVDLFNQYLPTEFINKYGGLREAIIPLNGLYSVNIGKHYKEPIKGIQSFGYIGKSDPSISSIITVANNKKINGIPADFEDLLAFQKSSEYKKALKDYDNLQTIIFENTMDPLPGHTIATRNSDIVWIKKGAKINNKWKPKQL